jgi:hypothetical protein
LIFPDGYGVCGCQHLVYHRAPGNAITIPFLADSATCIAGAGATVSCSGGHISPLGARGRQPRPGKPSPQIILPHRRVGAESGLCYNERRGGRPGICHRLRVGFHPPEGESRDHGADCSSAPTMCLHSFCRLPGGKRAMSPSVAAASIAWDSRFLRSDSLRLRR